MKEKTSDGGRDQSINVRTTSGVKDKRMSMMESKKSYSLDEYMSSQKTMQENLLNQQIISREVVQPSSIAGQHHQDKTYHHGRSSNDYTENLCGSEGRSTAGGGGGASHKKLLLLHSMKALQDSEELTSSQSKDQYPSLLMEEAAGSPSLALQGKTQTGGEMASDDRRKSSRLPIARLLEKLKM